MTTDNNVPANNVSALTVKNKDFKTSDEAEDDAVGAELVGDAG